MVDCTNKVAWDPDFFTNTIYDNMKAWGKVVDENGGFVDILNKVREKDEEIPTLFINAMLVDKSSEDATLNWPDVEMED